MSKDKASEIVKQWYTKASEPSLGYLLERYSLVDTGGMKFYRPFIVAALMIRGEQKTLIKADVAQWEINEKSFRTLLQIQAADDRASGLNIPPHLAVESLLEIDSGGAFGIGVMII